MPIEFPEFEWRSMTTAIEQIPRAPMMLQDMVFRVRNTNASQYVDVDVLVGGKKILPFVRNTSGGTLIGHLSGQMKSIKLPRIRPKKQFQAVDLLNTRGAGQNFYVVGGGDVASAREKKLGQELQDMRNRVDCTIEWMCSQALTGALSVASDEIEFSVDYGMPAANKPTIGSGVTADWSDSTNATIIADIQSFADIITDANVGVPGTLGLCGKKVANAILNDDKVTKALDNRAINVGQLALDANNQRIGNLNGIELYRYGGKVTAADDTSYSLLNDNVFVLIAPNARFSIEFGLILDLQADAAVVGEYFSKSWFEQDPSALMMLAESRPLPVLWQPEAVVYATVIAP